MDKRLTFNQDVKNYDKFRPSYPKELFKEIIDYSGLDCNKHAIEIGIGTGQATKPILETGCAVRAIEFGDKLAAYPKVLDLLKSGGTMALFWNRPFVGREDNPLHKAIQSIYNKYRPSR